MNIYVVQEGDTLQSIADAYGVTAQEIISTNELSNTDLVIGQTLVILIPEIVHTVVAGDTLDSIATQYGTTVWRILANNPNITRSDQILYIGDSIVIKYEGEPIATASIYGYVYPYVNETVLRKTLPYLTYLSIFNYGFRSDGELIPVEDQAIIDLAAEYNVGTLMTISAMTPDGVFSSELANTLFRSVELQEILIEQIVDTVNEKGYKGVDLDFEYIYASDASAYVTFANRLRQRLEPLDKVVFVALAPKISSDQPGLLYEGHDYKGLGNAVDYALLMTYEWGDTYGHAS